MFDVEIWGTVGEWVGGVGTALSAAAAVWIYGRTRKTEKWAQARLVRGYLHPTEDSFEVSVTNDSDRPISLEVLFYWEKSFRAAMLAGELMHTRDEIQVGVDQDGEPILSSGPHHDAYQLVRHKSELLGLLTTVENPASRNG